MDWNRYFRAASPAQQPPPATVVIQGAAAGKIPKPLYLIGGGILLVSLWMVSRSGQQAISVPNTGANAAPAVTDQRRVAEFKRAITPAQQNPDAILRQQQEAMQKQGQADTLYPGMTQPPAQTPAQTAADQERERLRKSLFADTRIPAFAAATPEKPSAAPPIDAPQTKVPEPPGSRYGVNPLSADKQGGCQDEERDGVHYFALCEGHEIPARTSNRLVGDFAGPVKAFTTADVKSRDGQHLLLPVGAILLGNAGSVNQSSQRRLSVSFHRILLDNGNGVMLDAVPGMDQAGAMALGGKVNRHLVSTFATAGLIGALAGFSQFGAGSVYNGSGVDVYRQGVASSMGQQGQQVIQQGQQRLPTITVGEGNPITIYLTADLHLPEFKAEK